MTENPIEGEDRNASQELRASRHRRHACIVFLLLCCTAIAGVAARSETPRPPHTTPPANATLHYGATSTGPIHFQGDLDRGSILRGRDGEVKMQLRLRADRQSNANEAVATDLVVILDRSTSMSGTPLANAKASVRELISQLGAEDRFALVSYGSEARVAIPLAPVDASHRRQSTALLAAIQPQGGTNMSSGLDLAHAILNDAPRSGRATRVLLISDGHANQGDATPKGLRTRATRAVESHYVISTVGVGDGFDENLMASLADAGTGSFYYVEHSHALSGVFAGEFDSARGTVASALRVGFELRPGVELVSAAGYPLERDGRQVAFRPGDLFGGQERRIWVTFRVPDGDLGLQELGEIALHYQQNDSPRELRFSAIPAVERLEDPNAYVARIDADAVARSLAVDTFNSMKREVANALRKDDEAGARASIEAYRGLLTTSEVDLGEAGREQLRVLGSFEAEAKARFDAPAPQRKRASKQMLMESFDDQRVGSKKSGSH